jgi:hypothetical protein
MFRRVVTALGLNDAGGDLSFNKSVTAVFTAVVVYCILHGIEIGTHLTVLALAVLAAGFGLKGLAMFFASYKRTDSVQMTGDVTALAKTVLAQRDADAGIDPA